MTSEQSFLSLCLPSDPSMLSVARSFVESACQAGNYDKSTIFAVVMATGEAFSNVVRHAHCQAPQEKLEIQCRLHENAVEVCILDQGPPFDVKSVPHFKPSEIRVGGRGVYLLRTLMDELDSLPRPGGGNRLRMVKSCHSSDSVRNCG